MKIYLAIPYTGQEEKSFEMANQEAAKLMAEGNIVFSPISHTHPIALAGALPGGWEYWQKFDESFLEWCDEIYVICTDGWEYSKGVIAEIALAQKFGKPIKFIWR